MKDKNRWLKNSMLILFISFLYACASHTYFRQVKDIKDIPKEANVIKNIEFFKQEKDEWCGPAVLQMVLHFYGLDEKQEIVSREVFDEREGVVKLSEMVFYPQSKGLKSYSFKGNLDDLKELISRGIPVVVFQKASKEINKGHYRLVVGCYQDWIMLADPLLGNNTFVKEKDFLELWNLGEEENWSMVALKDDSGLESKYKDSEVYFRDLATAFFRRGKYQESEHYWKETLSKSENTRYLYALAFTLLKAGKIEEAENYAKLALEKAPNNPCCLYVMGKIENREVTELNPVEDTESSGGALTKSDIRAIKKKKEEEGMDPGLFMMPFIAGRSK
jgi:predicted double-glycine peptidase